MFLTSLLTEKQIAITMFFSKRYTPHFFRKGLWINNRQNNLMVSEQRLLLTGGHCDPTYLPSIAHQQASSSKERNITTIRRMDLREHPDKLDTSWRCFAAIVV